MKNKLKWFTPTRITIILCVATMFIYWLSYMGMHNVDYPMLNKVSDYDPYIQQFDAFKKGQLHLDWQVDEKLMALENPYDPEQRKGVDFLWDRAYYDGKYYSYFGITPIVTVMYPFYLLSGILPAPLIMQLIYMLIFAIVFPKLLMMLFDRYGKDVSPVIKVLIGYTSYLSSLNLLFGRGRNPFYYIACTSAIAFITWFAYLFFKGIFEEEHKKRCIYFLFAGLMFALSFHARVNTAFTAVFFIVPVVIMKLIMGKRNIKEKLTELGFLGVFVVAGFIFSFSYNNARFDNPLEFGTNYQLTVGDVSKYKLDISEFDDAFKYYFEAEPLEDLKVGRMVFNDNKPENMDRYLYVSGYLGLYAIPFMMFSLVAVVIMAIKGKSIAYKITLASTVIGGFVMAWMNFCLGGVIFRYLADFSTEVSVCAALGMLFLFEQGRFIENKKVKILLETCLVLFLLYSIYKVFVILSIDSGNLFDIREDTFFAKYLKVKVESVVIK